MWWVCCSAWRGALCGQVGGARCADVVDGTSSFREQMAVQVGYTLTWRGKHCYAGAVSGTIVRCARGKEVAMQWLLMALWAVWTWSQDREQERLASPPLSESEAIQQSLEALRTAADDGDLPGRARLALAQHHLVDLLRYLEGKEGYRLFPGERKKVLVVQPLAKEE